MKERYIYIERETQNIHFHSNILTGLTSNKRCASGCFNTRSTTSTTRSSIRSSKSLNERNGHSASTWVYLNELN